MPQTELIICGMLLLCWTSSMVLAHSPADYRPVRTSLRLSVSGNHVGKEQASSQYLVHGCPYPIAWHLQQEPLVTASCVSWQTGWLG